MKTDVYDEDVATPAGRSQSGTRSGSSRAGINKEEMMKQMKAAGTPGPAHKALGEFVGNWKAEVKCWFEPGSEPNVSQATSKVDWTLDGHFLQEEFKGDMMGQPFTGRTLLGFDNIKQKFNSVWVDSLHTSMFVSEGKGDSGYKTITLEGTADCPATGRKNIPTKQVFRVQGHDKHTLEMYSDGNKSMEITYARQ